MMIPERPTLERRVLAALDGSSGAGPRIPVVLGGCGTGRTSLLLRLRDLIGRTQAQYVDVERIATTPERFLQALRESSPFPALAYGQGSGAEPGARDAFDAALAFLDTARAPGTVPATFLLDEFLELRTFESFPGLRSVLRDLDRRAGVERQPLRADQPLRRARASPAARRAGAVRDHPRRAAQRRRSPRHAAGRARRRSRARRGIDDAEDEVERQRDELARLVQALSDGRPSYARAIAETATAHGAARRRRSGQRARGAARARRPARAELPLLLRAAPAPRPRLRRAQGDPRSAGAGRAADADRDRAAPAPHARVDEGLPVVARGRRPDRLAAEALQLRRPDAAPLGPPALPRRCRPATTTSPASCTPTCRRACPTPSPRWPSPAAAPGEREKNWGIIEID